MRILVFSDTHGDVRGARRAMQNIQKFQKKCGNFLTYMVYYQVALWNKRAGSSDMLGQACPTTRKIRKKVGGNVT